MKSIIVTTILISIGSLAQAGQGPCLNPKAFLLCQELLEISSGQYIVSSSNFGNIADTQPEPFDPSSCEASVVIATLEEKFVANYIEKSVEGGLLTVFVDAGRKETLLAQSLPINIRQNYSNFRYGTRDFRCRISQ